MEIIANVNCENNAAPSSTSNSTISHERMHQCMTVSHQIHLLQVRLLKNINTQIQKYVLKSQTESPEWGEPIRANWIKSRAEPNETVSRVSSCLYPELQNDAEQFRTLDEREAAGRYGQADKL